MFLDTRLGNTPRWFLGKPKDWDMRVPDSILKSVVFVGRLEPDSFGGAERVLWAGTAFLLAVPCADKISCFMYLITVKHVADQLAGKRWLIRFNTKDGKSDVVMGDDSVRWWKHPTEEKSVDVALAPWAPPEHADAAQIPVSMMATDQMIREHNIGVGNEVFYTGLFTRHMGQDRNLPIVRMGNVAMIPDEQLPNASIGDYSGPIDAYLVEVRSVGGLSGSPVFVRETLDLNMPLRRLDTGERVSKIPVHGAFYLLGMMHGHWNIQPSEHNRYDFKATTKVSESIALGISVVVPAKKILEVLNQPELAALRERHDREWQAQQGSTSPD